MPDSFMESFPRQHARTRRFTCGVPRNVRVASDGSRILFLRSSKGDDPFNALWSMNPADGKERLIASPLVLLSDENAEGNHQRVPAAELARRERVRESGGGIVAYDGLADLSRVCFVLDGRVFLAEVPGPDEHSAPRVVELSSSGDAYDPRISPEGTAVAYVSGSSVRLTGPGGDRRVIGGSSTTVSWGSAEFLAAEEMGRNRGHWWSPDDRQLLVSRVDTAGVPEWWLSSPVDPSSTPRAIRYPAAGTVNASVGLVLVNLEDGDTAMSPRTIEVDWSLGGSFEYLADVQWPEKGWPMVVAQTRDQRTMVVVEVNPDTGAVLERHRVTDDHWVDLIPGSPLQHDGSLLTIESQNGAYRLMRDGVALSPDGMQVQSIVGADSDSVVVRAWLDPLDIEVMRITDDGTVERLSGGGGLHTAVIGGGVVVVSVSDLDGLTTTVYPGEHQVESKAEEPMVRPVPTFHVVGQRALRTAVLLPAGHDGSPLPVLMDPYGGPHGQRVQRFRGQFLTSQWFADQGFAVVVVDGRGTPGRGPAWDREIWGDLALPVLDDQVEALQVLSENDERLDTDRVAIRGWSFGGYLAALAVLRRPDVFHAAVAGAPVTDWHLYDTHYTERYLGHPEFHTENYARSGLCDTGSWAAPQDGVPDRPLLMVHGLADDNVVIAHTLALSRVLLEQGRPHQVLPLSGVTHMTPQEEVAKNVLLVQLAFLQEALGIEVPS
ncbi:MAG: prolyl oligopeptidase family serine peptidase [Acidimicrobiales bacterium]|nr:prolyl oligopeptidase family serine peptidase [Acidimicrobiales bacterium]